MSDKATIRISTSVKDVLEHVAKQQGVGITALADHAILKYAAENTIVMSLLPEYSQEVLAILVKKGGEAGMLPADIAKQTGYTIKRVAAVLGSLMNKGLAATDGTIVVATAMGFDIVKEGK